MWKCIEKMWRIILKGQVRQSFCEQTAALHSGLNDVDIWGKEKIIGQNIKSL